MTAGRHALEAPDLELAKFTGALEPLQAAGVDRQALKGMGDGVRTRRRVWL
jgi:hypothetical protein